MGDKLLPPYIFSAIPTIPIDEIGIVGYNDSIEIMEAF